MKYAYPALLIPEEGLYNVVFPDLPDCYTCGDDAADAAFMASDALSGYLAHCEARGEKPKAPSEPEKTVVPAGALLTMVVADTEAYRRKVNNRAVRKTLTIPAWMNEEAQARHLNFSKVLQDALAAILE